MIKTIEVYLITGFLGSGKTSCLNHIFKNIPHGVKAMILMNEFGTVGIDGVLVETDDLNILEINKGSIFCACAKTDFIKALAAIASQIRPDVLFIEATGVANPADIKRDLQLPFFKGAFNFQKQLCLIDLANFTQEFELFASAEYQIRAADICVLNKSDLSEPGQIATVKNLICKHNPQTAFMETSFGKIDLTQIFPAGLGQNQGNFPMTQDVTPAELAAVMRGLMTDLSLSLNPPDTLVSAVYQWQGGSRKDFEQMLAQWPADMVRMKALLKFNNDDTLRFDWIMGRHTFSPYNADAGLHKNYAGLWNHIVILAEPEPMRKFETEAANTPELAKAA